MTDENQMVFDGFGDHIYQKPKKRGRPPFEWTQENSIKVSYLLSFGVDLDRIAKVIVDPRTGKSICRRTLERHFSRELESRAIASLKMDMKHLMEADAAASAGNVGAMRLRDQMVEKQRLKQKAWKLGQVQTGETSAPKLGKKASAARRAKEIVEGDGDNGWGDDLKPGVTH